MLLTSTKKNNKKREIRLSKHEQDAMIFDNDYYFQNGKFHYAVGLVPETRMRKLIGKKDTYFVLKYNDRDLQCLERVHDLTTATFELSWAVNADFYNKMFAEMRSAMKPEKGNKKTMDKQVNTKGQNDLNKSLVEMGILSGIVSGQINTADLDKSDIDSFVKLEVNRELKRNKQKQKVLIFPETLPEM